MEKFFHRMIGRRESADRSIMDGQVLFHRMIDRRESVDSSIMDG